MLKKYFSILLALVFVLFLFGGSVEAAVMKSGEEVDINEIIEDDLYVAGGTVNIDSEVKEDLITAGGKIYLEGLVNQDFLASGGQVFIKEDIRGDMIVAGGEIIVEGDISDDVVVFGGQITFKDTSVIGGDLIIAGGTVKMQGLVRGELRAYAGDINIEGNVENNAVVKAGRVKIDAVIAGGLKLTAWDKIEFGDEGLVQGDLNYWSKDEDDSKYGAYVDGSVTYDTDLKVKEFYLPEGVLIFGGFTIAVINVLYWAFLIAILVWVGGRLFERAAQYAHMNFFPSMGYGALYFIGCPIVAVLLMATVIALPLGLFVLFLYGFGFLLLKPIISVVAAMYINRHFKYNWKKKYIYAVALGIMIGMSVLALIPIISILVNLIWLVVSLVVAGSLCAVLISKIKNENKKV